MSGPVRKGKAMTHRRAVIIALVILAFAAAAVMKGRMNKTAPTRDITIAVSVEPLSTPVYVAREKGFFRDEGLRVALQPYSAGVDALNATVAGRADFGTVADVPLMFAGLKGQKVFIIATIGSSSDHVKIVARRDRQIARPADLRGKTVGVRSGTSSEYFLSAFLTYNGVARRDVKVVGMQLNRMTDALAKGEIDAAVSWDPYVSSQQKALGNDAVTFMNRFVYTLNWNIVGNPGFLEKNPEVAERLLRALVRAADFIREHPGDAQEITARGIGRRITTLGDTDFDVHLGQPLLVNLESEARWAIRSGLTDREEVPDYLAMLYTKALEKVRPKAVTVIR
jgi:NitT/TauT family transport system substrate-binding protein